MLRRALSLTTLTLLGTLAGGAVWLTTSESGLQTAAQLAGTLSAGRLQIEQPRGSLLGPLDIGQLRWQSADLQIQAENLHLDWSPRVLLDAHLQIAELHADRLRLDIASSEQPTPVPTDLGLPLRVDIEKLSLNQLDYGNSFSARDLAARLSHSDGQYVLSDFRGASGEIAVTGQATLGTAMPLALAATAELSGQLEQHPLSLSLKAAGPLAKFVLEAQATNGIQGQATAAITPFADAPFASAKLALDGIDPAAWQTGAPTALFDLRADLGPSGAKGDGVAGDFTISNRKPGSLDRQRLPLESLAGKLDWQGDSARFTALRAALSGKGELTGRGVWQKQMLQLDLEASRLDAAQLVSSLRPTRLNGPLAATLGADRQSIKLDLKDAAYALLVEASHADGKVTLPCLELSAGEARLAAKGELALGGKRPFSAEGELSRFDPSRFAKAPSALINASFNVQGRLEPKAVVEGRFALKDSRLAGQPLSGQGQLSIDWPSIPLADVQLVSGANHIEAKGAFGRPGDALSLNIEAPQLAPFGLQGGLQGHLDLAGSIEQPKINGHLEAARLGLPGSVQLRGLSLKAVAAGQPASPLLIELKLAQLDTPEQTGLLKALHIQAEGSNQAHHLRASTELFTRQQLTLAAQGGLVGHGAETGWQGQLQELVLAGEEKARNLQLTAPTPLKLGRNAWALGPAQFQGKPLDWQASLEADADAQHLRARLSAHGSRVGQIDGQLSASMDGPWSLKREAPWQAKLKTEIADLGWLAELLGDQWQSEGHFSGELKLAGTPAHPLSSGRFRGEKLALHLKEQGLHLVKGELDIDLQDNLLSVRKLGFDSLLQPMPRPLRLLAGDEVSELMKQAGRLDVTGEMRLDRSKGADSAWLDFRLDRLGAFQLPDQWIMLSGNGRLSLQDNTFGAKGKLAVDAGYWELAPGGAPRLSEDVIVKRPGSQKTANNLRPKLDVDISTDLGKRFLFNGAGLNSRLVGDVRLRASGRDLPRASGSIRTRNGRFDAYGQQLAIERGVLNFQGLLDNPALDVRAVRQGLSIEPGVQISGTAQRPVVKLISDPELPEAEKLAWLILGHGPEQMSAGDATVLLSAAGGLLGNDSGNIIKQLKNSFGIDEFGVRTGQIGDTGARQLSSRVAGSSVDTTAATGNQILSVGKRLSSNAMLSYEQALGKAESIVKLTVKLSRQFSLIGRAGSDNAIDLFYTLSFGKD